MEIYKESHEDHAVLKRALDYCLKEFQLQLEFAERAVGLRKPHIFNSGLVPEDFENLPMIAEVYLKVRKNAFNQNIDCVNWDTQMCGYAFAYFEAGRFLTKKIEEDKN